MIVGIAAFVIAQTTKFRKIETHKPADMFDFGFSYDVEDTATKNTVLYGGITFFVIGGLMLVSGLSSNKKSES